MNKTKRVRALILVAAIVGSAAPLNPANAGGFIDLNFENVPTIIGLGVGILPDYSGSDDYTYGVAPFFRYTFQGQERYVQLLANELTVNLLDNDMFHVGPLITGHSIIAIDGNDTPPAGDDGVVKYTSAHVDYVESEFIVRSGHSCQSHPLVIEEVRRILLEHLHHGA